MLEQAIANPASRQQGSMQTPATSTELRKADSSEPLDDPDATLVCAFREGNTTAFDALVKRHERRLLNVALKITRNREDAEDAVQDSFLNVFKHVDSFRGDSRFVNWLTRITVNQALSTVRAHTRGVSSLNQSIESEEGVIVREVRACGYTPEQLCCQREFERRLLEWAACLTGPSKQVLALHMDEDLSDDEIAQFLGLTVSAVKTRLFRARRELRKRLQKYTPSGKT